MEILLPHYETSEYGRVTDKIKCLLSAILLIPFCINSQTQVYDNYEGSKSMVYFSRTGVLDSAAKNPKSNKINSSPRCALYVRNGAMKFDNIKASLSGKLTDVNKYATYEGNPPVLKMKVYTSAPAGTLIEILLGSKGRNTEYPAGTNSQYQAYTTKTNEWEELEFKFSQIPQGSETTADQVDQLTVLFNPNSGDSSTYYFDDIEGPPIGIRAGITGPNETPPKKTN